MTLDGATHTICALCDMHISISRERIATVFHNLSSQQDNIRSMGSAGAVPTLVAIGSKTSAEVRVNFLIALCLISLESQVSPMCASPWPRRVS